MKQIDRTEQELANQGTGYLLIVIGLVAALIGEAGGVVFLGGWLVLLIGCWVQIRHKRRGRMSSELITMNYQLGKAKEHFEPDEEAISTVCGAPDTWASPGIFVATNQRLIFYSKKLTGFELEVFPYKNISSIEMGKKLMGHHISFFASGNKVSMKWIKTGGVQEFVEVIKSRMTSSSSPRPTPTQTPDDPLAQLEKLSKLRAAGVVTKEEFESKKAEILERI